MRNQLILHDLPLEEAESVLPKPSKERTLFPAAPAVRHCVGCFGCWLKTPGKCVIKDRGGDFALLMPRHDELVILSRMVFGGLSPDVKAVLDRSIGFISPFFHTVNGEMHHVKRYDKTPDLKYILYGSDISEDEKHTARKLAAANALNFAAAHTSVHFCASMQDIKDALSSDAHSEGQIGQAKTPDAALYRHSPADTASRDIPSRIKIALINGSPRAEGSASGLIADALAERIGAPHECVTLNAVKHSAQEIMASLDGCGALVFVFPLYVDGIPSHLLRLLNAIRDGVANTAPGAQVYAVVNNGFYEGRQNSLALEMMRHFSLSAGLNWGQGLGVGAGGMAGAAPAGHGPMKNLGLRLDMLAKNIREGRSAEDALIEPNFPRFLYKTAAHVGWRQQAGRNGLKARRLYDRPGTE